MIRDGKVDKVGVEFFDSAVAAQALYKLNRDDWRKWLDNIVAFCEAGKTNVYAENALNELEGAANIYPVDMENLLCAEIDDAEDLKTVSKALKCVESRQSASQEFRMVGVDDEELKLVVDADYVDDPMSDVKCILSMRRKNGN